MLLFYENFDSFLDGESMIGTEEDKWSIFYSEETPSFTKVAGRDIYAWVQSIDPTKTCVLTSNNPNLTSVADIFIRIKTADMLGNFDFGLTFRYGNSGGLALYHNNLTEFRLISFSTADPFSSPIVLANLDAYAGYSHSDIWISANGPTIKIYVHGELISTVTTSVLNAGKFGLISYNGDWAILDIAAENFLANLLAPSGLTATAVDSESIRLDWINNIPDAGEILIEKKIGSGTWEQIDTAEGNAVSYIDEKSDSNILNTYRIRAASNLPEAELYWEDQFIGAIGESVPDWFTESCDFVYGPLSSEAIVNNAVSGSYIQSPEIIFSDVNRRVQIKIDAFSGTRFYIILRNLGTSEESVLFDYQTLPGTYDIDVANILWTEGRDWRGEGVAVEIWLEGSITIDFIKFYNQGLYNNKDTCYFQDFFEDEDDMLIVFHTPDINRIKTKFYDLSGGSWAIESNKLVCLYPPDDNSLFLDVSVRSYKASVVITIDNVSDFDYKFTVDIDKQFHIADDGLWLFLHDSVLLLHDPSWIPAVGDYVVYIEVNQFFISVTVGSNVLKYYNTKTPSTAFGIGTDSSETPMMSNLIFQQYKEYSSYSNEASVTINTLTIQEIWERYSEIKYERGIYVKRINSSGVYESEWNNINDLINFETRMYNVCNGITYSLPNNTYSLGAVTVDNASLLFANQSGQMSNEDEPNSIFHNYVRHKSMIKVVDSFIDSYTYPGSYGRVDQTTFEGFIDDRLCVTNSNDTENIIAIDILTTLLKSITLSELSLTTGQTIKNTIYQIMNRTLFTNFFTVSISNINPGFNASNLDLSEFDQSVTAFEILQELSIGHSIFYIRNGIFYYKADAPEVTTVLNLWESPQRKIKFNKFSSGGSTVFDKLYWQDSSETYISPTRTYDQSFAFSIKGIISPTQRQGLLNYAGPRLCQRKINFELTIPFLPILYILDRISILQRGTLQEGCFILDITRLDEGYFLEPVGAFKIETTDNWMIRKINHTTNSQTILTLEKII